MAVAARPRKRRRARNRIAVLFRLNSAALRGRVDVTVTTRQESDRYSDSEEAANVAAVHRAMLPHKEVSIK